MVKHPRRGGEVGGKAMKPKPRVLEVFDWNECTAFIEDKYGINTRDYRRSHNQFDEWCDVKGYGQKDSQGEDRGSSQLWYAEFQCEIESGKVKERPYQDFWHWIIDVTNVQNGGTIELCEELGAGEAEPWQKKILRLYLTEFGSGPYLTEW